MNQSRVLDLSVLVCKLTVPKVSLLMEVIYLPKFFKFVPFNSKKQIRSNCKDALHLTCTLMLACSLVSSECYISYSSFFIFYGEI